MQVVRWKTLSISSHCTSFDEIKEFGSKIVDCNDSEASRRSFRVFYQIQYLLFRLFTVSTCNVFHIKSSFGGVWQILVWKAKCHCAVQSLTVMSLQRLGGVVGPRPSYKIYSTFYNSLRNERRLTKKTLQLELLCFIWGWLWNSAHQLLTVTNLEKDSN